MSRKDMPPGPGRPKGSENKLTADIKQMIREALSEVGGVKYLVKQADENPKAFMALIGRLIPIDVDVTKKNITVMVGLYPEEKSNDGNQPAIAQEAAEGIHEPRH